MATARHDRRDEIHQAAIEIFCRKGFAAASMQDVADTVGILKGSLYHYVASKDELLKTIFVEAASETRERIAHNVALDVGPAERLRTFVEEQIRWYLANVEHGTVLLREGRYVSGRQRRAVKVYRERYETYAQSLIDDCVAAGITRPALNVPHAARFVLGAVDATPQWCRESGADAPETIARIYTDLTLAAVLG
jgi:AcrR family transcriptional regulator